MNTGKRPGANSAAPSGCGSNQAEDLPRHAQSNRQSGQQRFEPRLRRRRSRSRPRLAPRSVRTRTPPPLRFDREHAFPDAQFAHRHRGRARACASIAGFRPDEAAIAAGTRRRSRPAGETPESAASALGRIEDFMGKAVQARRAQRAGDELAVGRTDLDDAGDREERPARSRRRARATAVGGAQQRHVGRDARNSRAG